MDRHLNPVRSQRVFEHPLRNDACDVRETPVSSRAGRVSSAIWMRTLPQTYALALRGGLALGEWDSRSESAPYDQERFARAMCTSDDGFWDWIVADDTIYTSPRLLEIYGF